MKWPWSKVVKEPAALAALRLVGGSEPQPVAEMEIEIPSFMAASTMILNDVRFSFHGEDLVYMPSVVRQYGTQPPKGGNLTDEAFKPGRYTAVVFLIPKGAP